MALLRLQVAIDSLDGKQTWVKVFSLRQTRRLQMLHFPRLRAYALQSTVLAVKVGKDDDLCISELALSLGGKQIPWNLPRYVVSGGGFTIVDSDPTDGIYNIIDRQGHTVHHKWDVNGINAIAWQPKSSHLLLATDNNLFLYDTRTNRILSHHHFTNLSLTSVGPIISPPSSAREINCPHPGSN